VKFKTDENLPVEAAATLLARFDAETIWDEKLSGADDLVVASTSRNEGRILLTLDLDFANIRAYPPREHPGIIVLRLKHQDKLTIITYTRRWRRRWLDEVPSASCGSWRGNAYGSVARVDGTGSQLVGPNLPKICASRQLAA
jgi:predicted nuclease of predicted toxin-antitoxin system